MYQIRTTITLVTFCLFTYVAHAEQPGSVGISSHGGLQGNVNTGANAVAEKVMELTDNSKLEKLLFNFGGAKASLTQQGYWNIQGYVKHNRIRCATYQIGIRFGVAESGCTNVTWLTDYEYGTNLKHCNSARLMHSGGGISGELKGNLEKITCAEMKVRCFGSTCNQ